MNKNNPDKAISMQEKQFLAFVNHLIGVVSTFFLVS